MRILNVGSLNIDLVYQVEHFVRAGETLASTGFARYAGGKGLNQSVALARAGAQTYHAGKIGEDGLFLKRLLADVGANVEHVSETGSTTGTALIQVDKSGQNCILLYAGANAEHTKEELERALDGFGADDLLLTQNETNSLALCMRLAKARGMRVCLNPSPIDDALLAMPLDDVDCFLLNEVEGGALSGKSDPDDILSALAERYPRAIIVLTLGKDGCLCAADGKCYAQPCYPVKSVDSTAAGDTFTGYFLATLGDGGDIPLALRRAAMASAIAVTRKGASPSIPTRDEVERALQA